MKSMPCLVLLLGILSLFSGCLIRPQVPEFQGLSDFRINRDNPDKSLQVQVAARMLNTNRFPIKIKAYSLDVLLNGTMMGHADSKLKQVLGKDSSTDLRIGVKSSVNEIFSSTFSLLAGLGKPTIKIRIKGTVKVKARGISKSFPVDVEKEIPFSGK